MTMRSTCRRLAAAFWMPILLAALPVQAATPAEQAVAAAENGDHAKALDLFETALTADPDNLRVGTAYRQAVIETGDYERCIAFFQGLVEAHPASPNAHLNLGYAHVDKIPAEGAITQVLLANTALGHFSTSIELEDTWLVRYTRGNSYLFWPAIFGRTPIGIADLERALEIAEGKPKRPYHARAWAALGDGHWRLEDVEKARATWQEGLERFPDDTELAERLSHEGEALDTYLEARFDATQRVDTHLREIFEAEDQANAAP